MAHVQHTILQTDSPSIQQAKHFA